MQQLPPLPYDMSHKGSPWYPRGMLENWLKKERKKKRKHRKETNSVFVVFADSHDVNTHTVANFKQPTWSYWTQIWENMDRIRVNWVTSPGPDGRTGYRVAAIRSYLTLTYTLSANVSMSWMTKPTCPCWVFSIDLSFHPPHLCSSGTVSDAIPVSTPCASHLLVTFLSQCPSGSPSMMGSVSASSLSS